MSILAYSRSYADTRTKLKAEIASLEEIAEIISTKSPTAYKEVRHVIDQLNGWLEEDVDTLIELAKDGAALVAGRGR